MLGRSTILKFAEKFQNRAFTFLSYYLTRRMQSVSLNRGAENVRTRERGSGEISINNLKSENKWKFPLTRVNFHAPK